MPTPPSAAPAQLILTVAPDGRTIFVSARGADGRQSPSRAIAVDQDGRLGAFVANVRAIAQQHLASVESSMRLAVRRDGDPAIADAAHGEHGR